MLLLANTLWKWSNIEKESEKKERKLVFLSGHFVQELAFVVMD